MKKKELKIVIDTRLIEHSDYKGMYWVTWEDGDTDFYNITWAKEHLRRMDEDEGN